VSEGCEHVNDEGNLKPEYQAAAEKQAQAEAEWEAEMDRMAAEMEAYEFSDTGEIRCARCEEIKPLTDSGLCRDCRDDEADEGR